MIIDVAESSQVAAARRAASELARDLTADEVTIGRVAIVATELATNLLKHTGGGRLATAIYADASGRGIELLALDKGGGIHDLGRAMEDGFSTSGTAGGGLGAIKRQSDHFEVLSSAEHGTAMLARVSVDRAPLGEATIGSVIAPYPGEQAIGDAWAFASSPHGPTLMMIDGTGHGPLAAKAAQVAVDLFHQNINEQSVEILERINRGLSHTRGGAIAIARLDPAGTLVRYAGIGNISGAVVSRLGLKRMVSHNGTIGLTVRRIQEFVYPVQGPVLTILHSDGLSAKWDLGAYPGLAAAHPSLVAGVLFRDYWRSRDDGLVVALRAG
jgi:anti-sigma regulatory factor (Ser/Thr protein kinase)